MPVVVLTGASSGIGAATARLLGAHGYDLVLAARRIERLHALAQEIGDRAQVLPVRADLADPQDVDALISTVLKQFDRVDVWINNAGIGEPRHWLKAHPEEIERVLRVNLITPILATRAIAPVMIGQGRGHIINVASAAGLIGVRSVYSATKYGLRGHTESLRRELRRHGVRVSMVSPGFIKTEMTQAVPIKMPEPELVGRVILRLIQRPRREVIVPGWYRPLAFLNQVAPWFVDFWAHLIWQDEDR